jgi:hypothetical protein
MQNETTYNRCTQCILVMDRPADEVQGELKGTNKLHEGLGELQGLSPFRSDGSQGSQAGRLDLMSSGHKQLKGGLSGLGQLRSDGFHGSQTGG